MVAKNKKKTRSQIIRDYLNSVKPSERGPTAVSNALKKKGIKVTVNHVCMVKLGMGFTKRKKKKETSNSFDLKSTIIAKNLLLACKGDVNLAKTNLNLVSKLLG